MTNPRNDMFDPSIFIDALVDDLALMSDEKVLGEAIEEFGSIKAALDGLDFEIERVIASEKKERLTEARAALLHGACSSSRPKSAAEAYNQLAESIVSDDGFKRLTLAARNGKGSADDDGLSALFDLCELRQLRQSTPLPTFGASPKAEFILRELGVTAPDEIDVEAIAWFLGAKVRYGRLTQCEARIVGCEDAAVITVDQSVSPQRQRFSVCHELGHWILHRGKTLSCQANEIELPSTQSSNLERAADRFASELLMPSFLFLPIADSLGPPSMRVVDQLSEIFRTSRTATAIRLVELNERPLCLVNHGKNGRRWFTRSRTITGNWMPGYDLQSETVAFRLLFGKGSPTLPARCMNASAWFTRRDSSRFHVIEDSFRVTSNEVISLLAIREEKEFLNSSA